MSPPVPSSKLAPLWRRPELWGFLALLAALNLPVVLGASPERWVLVKGAISAGEWWRVITHPFVHVTWYHLLLDGLAFLFLYWSLLEASWCRRLLCVVGGAIGSGLAAWAATGLETGLCGLSGVAHGLMAVSAAEMLERHSTRAVEWRIGLVSLVVVVLKAGYEALSGRMFFDFLSFGLLGSPVAVSHAGGIVGGLMVWWLWRSRESSLPEATTANRRDTGDAINPLQRVSSAPCR